MRIGTTDCKICGPYVGSPDAHQRTYHDVESLGLCDPGCYQGSHTETCAGYDVVYGSDTEARVRDDKR